MRRNLISKMMALRTIKRWNFHPHVYEQNVAEHSHNVSVWVIVLVELFKYTGAIETMTSEDKANLIQQAVMHDWEESVSGDIPTLLKPHIKEYEHLLEACQVEAYKFMEIPSIDGILYRDVCRFRSKYTYIVQMADLLDALVYAMWEPNHFGEIVKELKKKLHDLVVKHIDKDFQKSIFFKLKKIGVDLTDENDWKAWQNKTLSHV